MFNLPNVRAFVPHTVLRNINMETRWNILTGHFHYAVGTVLCQGFGQNCWAFLLNLWMLWTLNSILAHKINNPNKWHYNISYFMKNHTLSSIIKPYSSHVTNIVYIIIVIKCHTYNYKYTIIYTHHTTIRSPSAFSPKPLPVHFKLHVVLSVATSPKYSTNDTQIPYLWGW